jgi:5-formyltetrahydrofolate cyclo-ligase
LQTGADSGSPFKVGYCASCQFVDRVPVDKNDVSMDALCTELSFYIL